MNKNTPARTILAAVVAVALFATAACSSSPDPSSGGGGGSSALAEGEFALEFGEPWPEGSWAGKVDGTDALVAIVSGPNGVVAYVCDDEEIGSWYRADEGAGVTQLVGADGRVLSAQFDGDSLVGSVQLPEVGAAEFTAAPAGDDALHRAFGFDEEEMAVAGWVTLPSGEQRGTISFLRIRRPTAPRTPTTSTTVRPNPTPPPPPKPVVVKAPPLVPAKPVPAPKPAPNPAIAPTIQLSPPNPMTPDAVGQPTANEMSFVWAAIGDSYASGEGAPVRPGGFGPGQAPPNWGPAMNHGGSSGPLTDLNVSLDERQACHRSESAGAPVANEQLKRDFPEVQFEFAHYACSGATTLHVMQGGYDGPDLFKQIVQPAQGERAARFAREKGSYDALYMSIGGNDAGFGPVIVKCLTSFNCHEDAIDVDGVPLDQKLRQLPQLYRNLNNYLRSPERAAVPRHILISKNPDPTQGDNGTTCGTFNNLEVPELLLFISEDEARWAREFVLEGGMNSAIGGTTALGWTVIDAHLNGFRNRGYCSSRRLINTNNSGLATQGDDYDLFPLARQIISVFAGAVVAGTVTGATAGTGLGTGLVLGVATTITTAATIQLSSGLLHPTVEGHQVYADAISASVRPLVEQKQANGLLPPARVRVASAVNNRSMTIRWDDLSPTEDRYEVTVTRLEGTGQVPSSVDRLPAGTQEYELVSNGPVAVRVEVRACVREVCSEPGTLEAANFVPKVPTGGTGGYVAVLTGPPLNRSTVTANAGWLPSAHAEVYVMEYTQITPSSTTVRKLVSRLPIGGIAIADPAFRSSGAPKALYGVRISACNRAGCSTFSPEVRVDTRGDAEIVDLSTERAKPLTVPLAASVLDHQGRTQVAPTMPAMPGDQQPRPGQPPVTLPQ